MLAGVDEDRAPWRHLCAVVSLWKSPPPTRERVLTEPRRSRQMTRQSAFEASRGGRGGGASAAARDSPGQLKRPPRDKHCLVMAIRAKADLCHVEVRQADPPQRAFEASVLRDQSYWVELLAAGRMHPFIALLAGITVVDRLSAYRALWITVFRRRSGHFVCFPTTVAGVTVRQLTHFVSHAYLIVLGLLPPMTEL
jgi:hypothetical protein